MSEYLNLAIGASLLGVLGFFARLWYKSQKQSRQIQHLKTKEKIQNATKKVDDLSGNELIDLFNKLFPRKRKDK